MEQRYARIETLFGVEAMQRINKAKVLLVGVGGVGGWCAEALVRSGIENLTLMDFDTVQESNLNRQLVATEQTIGKDKTVAMREHLLEINNKANIIALQQRYSTEADIDFNKFDYVVDCIDSVADKLLLIINTLHSTATLFSAMGAGKKTDPTKVKTAQFEKVTYCPLARTLRKQLKQRMITLPHSFTCVYSDEQPQENADGQAVIGSFAPVVGVFGLTLASLVLNDIRQKCNNLQN